MFKKGYTYKMTDEHKRKIGLKSKGRKCTPEAKEKNRLAHLGKVYSVETRKKVGDSARGKKHSDEWRKNISIGNGSKKGWITPENDKKRHTVEMNLWKKGCIQRDNFTDQKTGKQGGILHVHHINNFSQFPELRTSLENGITLSKESHELFHKIYGKQNNTRSQLEEFLSAYE